jgi:hypothetical protein
MFVAAATPARFRTRTLSHAHRTRHFWQHISNPSPELSSSSRAGCQDKVCKENGTKIQKGELRLGTWVEIQDHGSWRWKHW